MDNHEFIHQFIPRWGPWASFTESYQQFREQHKTWRFELDELKRRLNKKTIQPKRIWSQLDHNLKENFLSNQSDKEISSHDSEDEETQFLREEETKNEEILAHQRKKPVWKSDTDGPKTTFN